MLAGDPHQLGPVLRSSLAEEFGLNISFLERLSLSKLYERDEVSYASSGYYNSQVATKLVKNYRYLVILKNSLKGGVPNNLGLNSKLHHTKTHKNNYSLRCCSPRTMVVIVFSRMFYGWNCVILIFSLNHNKLLHRLWLFLPLQTLTCCRKNENLCRTWDFLSPFNGDIHYHCALHHNITKIDI